jgi:hypothetical protein
MTSQASFERYLPTEDPERTLELRDTLFKKAEDQIKNADKAGVAFTLHLIANVFVKRDAQYFSPQVMASLTDKLREHGYVDVHTTLLFFNDSKEFCLYVHKNCWEWYTTVRNMKEFCYDYCVIYESSPLYF